MDRPSTTVQNHDPACRSNSADYTRPQPGRDSPGMVGLGEQRLEPHGRRCLSGRKHAVVHETVELSEIQAAEYEAGTFGGNRCRVPAQRVCNCAPLGDRPRINACAAPAGSTLSSAGSSTPSRSELRHAGSSRGAGQCLRSRSDNVLRNWGRRRIGPIFWPTGPTCSLVT